MKKWGVVGLLIAALVVGVIVVRQPARFKPGATGEAISCGWCGLDCVPAGSQISCAAGHIDGYSCENVNNRCVKAEALAGKNSLDVVAPKAIITPGGGGKISRKVFSLVFNPLINGQKLNEYMKWGNPDKLNSEIADSLLVSSNSQVEYQVVQSAEYQIFPVKLDGFTYDQTSYLNCLSNRPTCHVPDEVNYSKILTDYGICEKLNSGEIDELWMWGGPFFGYYESRLAGPGGFGYNSNPLPGTTCGKLLPIMGFNYEVGADQALHSYGHRTEATMTQVYGSWFQNSEAHNWDRFAMVKVQSPNFGYSGCGDVHYPPNALQGYDYSRGDNPVDSTCVDFNDYPNLTGEKTTDVTCKSWGCTQMGYLEWWYSQIPHFEGVGPDGKLNNWWVYIADPNTAIPPPGPTATPVPTQPPLRVVAPNGGESWLEGTSQTIYWTRPTNYVGNTGVLYVTSTGQAVLIAAAPGGTRSYTWTVTLSQRSPDNLYKIRIEAFNGAQIVADESDSQFTIPSLTPTAEPTVTPSVTPEPTPTPVVLALRFQGVTKNLGEIVLTVMGTDGNQWSVTMQGDEQGNYTGILPVGVTEIVVSRSGYLHKKIVVGDGQPVILWVGDFDGDNDLDADDLGLMLADYGTLEQVDLKYDLNGDGKFDIGDVSLVLGNYVQPVLAGD